MGKPLIIFGTSSTAELAHYYFNKDSNYSIAAFTVNSEHIDSNLFQGLPIVPYEEIEKKFSPAGYELFIAVGYSGLNSIRKNIFISAKEKGYKLASFVSSKASFSEKSVMGENCFILEHNTIQPFVEIGDNVIIWSGNHVGHHSNLGNHTFITSHVVISGKVQIGERCFLGVNSTIRNGITIGDRCIIGAGALILQNAEADGIYMGAATTRSKVPSSRIQNI
jgi:sugar O-acyltransferase (sialic acid O-acetyltransferase NeuD family)